MKLLRISIVAILFSTAIMAQQNLPYETPSLNRRVRNLGMGNVGVAIQGTHESSPFYNPAGLNDLDKGRFEFFSPTAEVSSNAIGLIGDVKDLVDNIDAAENDAAKTRALNDFVQENSGKFRHVRFTLDIFNYARKNFAAGLLIDERFDLSVRKAASVPEFNVRNLGDAAFYVAGSHDFWEKLLQVGVTLKPTVRFSIDEQDEVVNQADVLDDTDGDPKISNQFKKIEERRFGLGADVGFKSNLGLPLWKDANWFKLLQPAVGITWQDIGSPKFGAAPDNQQSISAGAAIHPALWKLKNVVALDVREINQERPFLSKLHFGVESKLPWLLAVRAGVSQGYVTGGATVDLWLMKVDAAVYYEEIGIQTRQEGNLRFAANLSFNI